MVKRQLHYIIGCVRYHGSPDSTVIPDDLSRTFFVWSRGANTLAQLVPGPLPQPISYTLN